jgi:hypothetical protein
MPLKPGNPTAMGMKGPGNSRLDALPFIQRVLLAVKEGVTT